MDETIEKEIKYFKEKMVLAINMFFALKQMYEKDDDKVLKLVHEYKSFLAQFHEKYPNISVVLDEEDFTPDDFKIFLLNYSSENEILKKYQLADSPLFLKINKNNNKLQVFLNYDTLDVDLSQDLKLLALIAIENIERNKIILTPENLQTIGNMSINYHGKDCVFTAGNKF